MGAHQHPELQTLTIEELAELLCRSPATIRSDLCRSPDRLPPFIKVGQSIRFRITTTLTWLQQLEGKSVPSALPVLTRRGRPTKSEQVARLRRGGGES